MVFFPFADRETEAQRTHAIALKFTAYPYLWTFYVQSQIYPTFKCTDIFSDRWH